MVALTSLLIKATLVILAFFPYGTISIDICSGIVMETATYLQDVIYSPGYLSLPRGNMNCELHISTGSSTSIVMLTVADLYQEDSPNCTKHYVAIYDGPSKNSTRTEMLCGNVSQEIFNSTGSDMTVVSYLDGQQDDSTFGFMLLFWAMDDESRSVTNLIASEDVKFLYSPRTGYFTNTKDYEWHISTGSNSNVVAVETYGFLTDDIQPQCTNNYVEVYDGNSTNSPRIKLMCGDVQYASFSSTSSEMTILFHFGRQENTHNLFYFRYQAMTKIIGPVASCTDVNLKVTDKLQYITTPNYPSWYPSNTDCHWHITTGSTSRVVELRFQDFNLEQSYPACSHDYVKIYAGPSAASSQSQLLCDNRFQNYNITNSSITIDFHSDWENNYKGFNLSYQFHQEGYHYRPDKDLLIVKAVLLSVAGLTIILFAGYFCKKRIARRRRMKSTESTQNPNASPEETAALH